MNALYVESATGQLRDVSGYADDERNAIECYQLRTDAHTGDQPAGTLSRVGDIKQNGQALILPDERPFLFAKIGSGYGVLAKDVVY